MSMLTPKEMSDELRVPERTLKSWRTKPNMGPPFIKLGRLVRYPRAQYEAWVAAVEEQQLRRSLETYGPSRTRT